MDLARLGGRVHEWGAVYQAYLASNLRRHGVVVELDQKTEMARTLGSAGDSHRAIQQTYLNGTDAARAFAAWQGLDWDSLSPERKIGLLKSGVQNPREAKVDGVSDLAAWQRTAETMGYKHRSVLRPDEVAEVPTRAERLEAAYRASLPLLDKHFDRRAVIDGSDARVAAAKGLISAGIETADDVDAVTRAYRERGVRRQGKDAALIWGAVNRRGTERIAMHHEFGRA